MRYGAIVVAAGCSTRMRAFKPMLPLGQETIIQRVIRTLREADVEDIVVVTGFRGDELEAHLACAEVRLVRNQDYGSTGMYESICLGMRALLGTCGRFFVMPGDVPLVQSRTLLQMRESNSAVVRPMCGGRPGHPLLLDADCIKILLQYSGLGGLRGAVNALSLSTEDMETDDFGVLLDADTPEDYQRVLCCLERRGDGHFQIRHALRAAGRVCRDFGK